MRRFVLILLYVTSTVCSFAWNDDSHLNKLVECINDSDFTCAEQQLSLIKDWRPVKTWLITFRALTFLRQADTITIEKQYLDSFRLYMAQEADSYRRRNAKRGEYETAILYGRLAAKLYAQVLGKNHPRYAVSLNNLGGLFASLYDYQKARKFYLESERIAESFSDEYREEYAIILNNIGTFYHDVGNYVMAEQYYQKVLLLRNELLEDVLQTTDAALLSNLGMLYKELGEYEKAEKYSLRALELDSIEDGIQSADFASSLSNLGIIYEDMKDYSKAELYQKRALEIRATIFEEDHPDYLCSLSNLGVLYCQMKKFYEAEKFGKQVLQIRARRMEESPLEYASSLHNLGFIYYKMKEYNQAEHYYLEALKIRERKLSRTNLSYMSTMNNMGVLCYEMGKYEAAEPYYKSCSELYKEHYFNALTYLSEKQRSAYWETIRNIYDLKIPRLTYHLYSEPSSSIMAYDNELFYKGVLLQSIDIIKRSVIESGDTALVNMWDELINLKQYIYLLQDREPESSLVADYVNTAELLEKSIIRESVSYQDIERQWNISWDSVRSELDSNQVAIEYMRAPLSEDTTMYCALLLRDTCSYPILMPLFEEKEVFALISSDAGETYDYEEHGKTLSQFVWGKVLPYIKPGESVYFAPTGLLHQLAIESLPYDANHTMADVYNMVRVSSTREIVLDKSSGQHATATLYGGIQYSLDTTKMATESRKYPEVAVKRSLDADSMDRGNIRPLPGTRTEVEQIDAMLRQNHLQAKVYVADTANEESFKNLSGKHQNILHIATHGFYWPDSAAQKRDYFTQRSFLMEDNQSAPRTIDPLNRCGLLFAGAQTAWSGHSADLPEGVQDGILTAKEISLMDLRDADLVVLSACETGKGEITGDGVFGLQRAFKMAGARTIIMSLWSVNDFATQMLMTEFYKNWITLQQPKREAFRNAQNAVRQKYTAPYYWAGFIMLD